MRTSKEIAESNKEIHEELISLQNQHGKDCIRIISNREEGDKFVKKFDYYIKGREIENRYSYSHSNIIDQVNFYLKVYNRILIIEDLDSNTYRFYFPRGEERV